MLIMARDVPGGPVVKTLHSQGRGPGSIPGQGTRSHMPQLRPSIAQEIKINFFLKKERGVWTVQWFATTAK